MSTYKWAVITYIKCFSIANPNAKGFSSTSPNANPSAKGFSVAYPNTNRIDEGLSNHLNNISNPLIVKF
jgi:hypothetical protein